MNVIYNRDCIEGMGLLERSSCDLMVADPPFGIEFDGTNRIYGERVKDQVVEGYEEVPAEGYGVFSRSWIAAADKVLKATASAYIISGWSHVEEILAAGRDAGWNLTNHVIWEFPFGIFAKRKYVTSHYHILYYRKDRNNYTFNGQPYTSDVWHMQRNPMHGETRNANALPLKLVKNMILDGSNPGNMVIDPFLGSGTTLVACQQLGRDGVGFEINKNACDFAVERCAKQETLKSGGLFR